MLGSIRLKAAPSFLEDEEYVTNVGRTSQRLLAIGVARRVEMIGQSWSRSSDVGLVVLLREHWVTSGGVPSALATIQRMTSASEYTRDCSDRKSLVVTTGDSWSERLLPPESVILYTLHGFVEAMGSTFSIADVGDSMLTTARTASASGLGPMFVGVDMKQHRNAASGIAV